MYPEAAPRDLLRVELHLCLDADGVRADELRLHVVDRHDGRLALDEEDEALDLSGVVRVKKKATRITRNVTRNYLVRVKITRMAR